MVQAWDKMVIDRDGELKSWVDFVFKAIEQGKAVYAYANNHYQGHGPATIRKFIEL